MTWAIPPIKAMTFISEIRLLKGQQSANSTPRMGTSCSARGASIFSKVRQAMDDINYRGWIQIEAAAPRMRWWKITAPT